MCYKKIFVFVIVFSIFCAGCDIKNPTEGLEIRLKNISRTTYIAVELIDGGSGQAINTSVNVKFEGQNKGMVINSANEPISQLTTNNGLIQFSLLDNITPSMENPYKIILILDGNIIINTSVPIRITKTGVSKFSAVLTNLNDLPDGVISHSEQSGSTGVNGTSQEIDVSSGKEPSSNASARIIIPEETKLLDENGQILSGNVETRVTYYNPIDEQSLASFPGGFFVTAEQQGGQELDGLFTTAGFVAVDMKVGGTEVEGFSKDVKIEIEVPAGLQNPESGSTVKEGDQIPLWSYDEDNGKWKFQEMMVLGPPASGGTYSVAMKTCRHLSYWNLDWFNGNYCMEGVTLDFISNTGCFDKIKAEIRDQTTGELVTWWSQKTIYRDDHTMTLRYAPVNAAVRLEVYEYVDYYQNGPLLASVNIPDLCEEGRLYEVKFTPQNSDYQVITLNVQARCNNSDNNATVVSLDGYPIYAKKAGEYYYYYIGELEDGTLQLCLEFGAAYYFLVYYKNEWYYSENYNDGEPFTIDKTTFDFVIEDEPEICGDL